jgi:hypothetical protein
MATYRSRQVTDKMPIPSHGYASSLKAQHFQIALGLTLAADVIELGYLPDYAVPVSVTVHHTAAIALITVGTAADPDGLLASTAVVANVPLRGPVAVEMFKNLGLGGRLITATVGTGGGSAGTLNVLVEYVVEDAGVGYPLTAAA